MWKRVCVLLVAGYLGMGYVSAQTALDDIDLLLPGLTISVFEERDSFSCQPEVQNVFERRCTSFLCEGESGLTPIGQGFDAVGNLYRVNMRMILTESFICGTQTIHFITRTSGDSEEVVARMLSCGLAEGGGIFDRQLMALTVDSVNGRIDLVTKNSVSFPDSITTSFAILRISGLPSLLDIIPTFQPTSETLSWITPKHPEALPAADNFQVYAGNIDDLRRDRDFTSAVPVDCSVPDVGPPAPGDYLSILDPLNPAKGKVEYAIVGVEHAGRQRFGRQNSSGILTGREPTAFSSCG